MKAIYLALILGLLGTSRERAMAWVPESVPLISRQVLFGNPERAGLEVSPDGRYLSWLAPDEGVLNVWVAPVGDPGRARVVTKDRSRGIRIAMWTYSGRHLLYLQDRGGDENWRLYAVDVEAGTERDLTPLTGVQARIESISPERPREIVIALNDRDPQLHDLHLVDLVTGDRKLLLKNSGFVGFLLDRQYQVKLAARFRPDGGSELLRVASGETFEPWQAIPPEDSLTTNPIDFDRSGKVLYLLDSRGRDKAALMAVELETGAIRLLAEDPKSDIQGVLLHPKENRVQAVSANYLKQEWKVLDSEIEEDFRRLKERVPGELVIQSRTLDDRLWAVAGVRDDGPVEYYLYDRVAKEVRYLFSNRPALEKLPLVPMHARVIGARDGLELVSYLSLPPGTDPDGDGKPSQPLPMVLNVHGGPWARDVWGFNSQHQWLANRGYAVLSVNFRGSTGFGKGFLNAGNLEWAGKMHNDLIDAVDWAIAEKVADPKRVAIFGGSYGGYATLVGLTFTPEKFAAGVDIVGPSNLETLLASIPPYWAPMLAIFHQRMGNPTTPEGKKLLEERSPLHRVDRIQRPLLIAQGANDPRVKQAESDQIVKAMKAKGIPVTYVLFPDEGHGFARPQNRTAFYAIAEAFLAKHLGGRFEPVGNDFAGSSFQVLEGLGGVPGLETALAAPTKVEP